MSTIATPEKKEKEKAPVPPSVTKHEELREALQNKLNGDSKKEESAEEEPVKEEPAKKEVLEKETTDLKRSGSPEEGESQPLSEEAAKALGLDFEKIKPETKDGDESPSPKTAEDWKRFKETERKKLEAEFSTDRFDSLEKDLKAAQEERDRYRKLAEEVNFKRTPKYVDQFVAPKKDLVDKVAELGQDDDTVKKVVELMQSGALNLTSFPDLTPLTSLQQNLITNYASRWIEIDQDQRKADTDWESRQEEFSKSTEDLRREVQGETLRTIGQTIGNRAVQLVPTIKERLPGFSEADQNEAFEKMQQGGTDYIAAAVVSYTSLVRQLKEALLKQEQLEGELGELKDTAQQISSGERMSSGRSTSPPVTTHTHDALRKRLEAKISGNP